MFSMVSQWDLTCFLAAPNSNRSQEEKALKMMEDQSLSKCKLGNFPSTPNL